MKVSGEGTEVAYMMNVGRLDGCKMRGEGTTVRVTDGNMAFTLKALVCSTDLLRSTERHKA